ncbi:MAG TPA: hypothetical protein DEQ02_07830 [Ruminococcaceae bacterium]|nr:hypothetical protein [Oscillospiraceae bacterium]
MKKVCLIAFHNIRKWTYNPRIYIIIALMFCFMGLRMSSVAKFANAVGYSTTIWFFPYIGIDGFLSLVIPLGLILLFCDAPFIDAEHPLMIIRSGKKSWAYGQVLYIIIASAVFWILIFFLSIVFFFPNVEFSSAWGKVLGTLAQTDAGQAFGINMLNYELQNEFTPLMAFGLSFLLYWLVGIFLGLLMLVLNLRFSRAVGAIVAVAFIVFDGFLSNILIPQLYYISPVSWLDLTYINFGSGSFMPSFHYVLIFLLAAVLFLLLDFLRLIRKKPIEILPTI